MFWKKEDELGDVVDACFTLPEARLDEPTPPPRSNDSEAGDTPGE